MKKLIVIPARGGSRGVPRKNLRPLLGKPLIWYSIKAALGIKDAFVLVSTDDEEIGMLAKRFGSKVCLRPKELAMDQVPLDPVIVHATTQTEIKENAKFDVVITFQPTAPLIRSANIESVINILNSDPKLDTVVTVMEDRHLRWRKEKGRYIPEYKARVNRQELPETYRETGAILACRRSNLTFGSRIGKNVGIYVMPPQLCVDIDTPLDFQICEALLCRRRIVISVIGSRDVGLGHVYRGLVLAGELIKHDITFLVEEKDDLALALVEREKYNTIICRDGKRLETLLSLKPDMVINDVLSTTSTDILAIKKENILVVNFEDLGSGAGVADLVINELYPYQSLKKHILVGEVFTCLRPEFLYYKTRKRGGLVKRILLTFGGVDEGNLTCRTLKIIKKIIIERQILIDIVVGPGFGHMRDLKNLIRQMGGEGIRIITQTRRISDFMDEADLCVTSGGRTVLELAAMSVPTVVICQNKREITHTFANSKNGILNLGHRKEITDEFIQENLVGVINHASRRKEMIRKMKGLEIRKGTARVVSLIGKLIGDRRPG